MTFSNSLPFTFQVICNLRVCVASDEDLYSANRNACNRNPSGLLSPCDALDLCWREARPFSALPIPQNTRAVPQNTRGCPILCGEAGLCFFSFAAKGGRRSLADLQRPLFFCCETVRLTFTLPIRFLGLNDSCIPPIATKHKLAEKTSRT